MDLYLHAENTEAVQRLSVAPTARVRDLIVGSVEDGDQVWLEDADEPLDLDAALTEVGLTDRAHLHRSRCRQVAVTVRFGGETKERDFAPGATVNRVFQWAVGRQGFNLSQDQRGKHTLGVTGTEAEADRDTHIGSLATQCGISFDLAPKARYAG